MKNENSFQVAKVQARGVAQHLLDANFSLALLIKKACMCQCLLNSLRKETEIL